mmetsp:Transcript_16260/g.45436  ORF Transcript_16260/g.45436 Transcript_16260/m.45436 type:complete len:201 (+) Transcript_16260:205-807(+)
MIFVGLKGFSLGFAAGFAVVVAAAATFGDADAGGDSAGAGFNALLTAEAGGMGTVDLVAFEVTLTEFGTGCLATTFETNLVGVVFCNADAPSGTGIAVFDCTIGNGNILVVVLDIGLAIVAVGVNKCSGKTAVPVVPEFAGLTCGVVAFALGMAIFDGVLGSPFIRDAGAGTITFGIADGGGLRDDLGNCGVSFLIGSAC